MRETKNYAYLNVLLNIAQALGLLGVLAGLVIGKLAGIVLASCSIAVLVVGWVLSSVVLRRCFRVSERLHRGACVDCGESLVPLLSGGIAQVRCPRCGLEQVASDPRLFTRIAEQGEN